jgi:hypothetical protein
VKKIAVEFGSMRMSARRSSAAASPWANVGESRRLQRQADVLAVLTTARVGGVRTGGEGKHLAVTALMQIAQCAVEEGGGVAVAPEDRQIDTACRELCLECCNQLAVLRVDRADSAEGQVVVRDLLEALARYAATCCHALKEGHDLVGPLRAAKGGEQESGVGHRRMSTAVAASTRRPV